MSIHRAFWLALLALGFAPPAAPAGPVTADDPAESGEAVPNPARQGIRLGDTGLALGGYVTGEAEDLEGDDYYSEAEGNLFVFYEPSRYFRFFADFEFEPDQVALERSYFDLTKSDALKLRLGKFLTPIGRWNQAHIEPLTWTTAEPVMIESIFDDTISGASLHGSVFPGSGALSYAVYGALVDAIEVDADEDFAERSAGARLEWASLDSWTAGLSYYASRPYASARWHHLGGADLLWQPHRRVELSAEALAGEGSRSPGAVYAGYAQAAIELWPTLHAVGRYEALSFPQADSTVRLSTLGLVWAPQPWARLKGDYTFTEGEVDEGEPGARFSLSFLF